MRLLVPDAMPMSLLPELESRRRELACPAVAVPEDDAYVEDDDAWRALRRYEPEQECADWVN